MELARIEKEEVRAGRPRPDERDKDAILELFNRAGGAKRSGDLSREQEKDEGDA